MGPKNLREKEDLESQRPPLRKVKSPPMAPSQSPRGRDLPRRTRTRKLRPSQSRIALKSPRMVRRSKTRLSTERRAMVSHSPKSLPLLKLRRRLAQMARTSLRRRRGDLRLLRIQRSNIDPKVALLRRKPPQLSKARKERKAKRLRRKKRRRKKLQRTLFTKTQWNLLKRENSNPSGKSTDTVIGERAQARPSSLSKQLFLRCQRNFSSHRRRKLSIPNSKKLRTKLKRSTQVLKKKRLNSKKFCLKSKLR